jgi:polyketide synthase PksN
MEARLDLDDADRVAGRYVDVAGLVAGCDRKMTGAEVYAALADNGLDNGPEFQVIDEVLFREDGAVAYLSLPPAAPRTPADVLHPAIVNGAFQAVVAAMAQDDADGRAGPRLYLPFSVGRIEIGEPLPDKCVVQISRISSQGSASVRRFDLTVADNAGRVFLAMHDFALIEAQDR